jgi:hypothetical protein
MHDPSSVKVAFAQGLVRLNMDEKEEGRPMHRNLPRGSGRC